MNNPQFTQSELTWITTLRNQLGFPVPEPVSNLDGHMLTTISAPGVPQGKVVSLMRWVDGYLQIHSLPAAQLEHLDLFMTMPYATNVLWSSAMIIEDPAMRAENENWRNNDGKTLLRFFNEC
jgi:Ser/Thr protein kinase RdoA (MazF antagonist)